MTCELLVLCLILTPNLFSRPGQCLALNKEDSLAMVKDDPSFLLGLMQNDQPGGNSSSDLYSMLHNVNDSVAKFKEWLSIYYAGLNDEQIQVYFQEQEIKSYKESIQSTMEVVSKLLRKHHHLDLELATRLFDLNRHLTENRKKHERMMNKGGSNVAIGSKCDTEVYPISFTGVNELEIKFKTDTVFLDEEIRFASAAFFGGELMICGGEVSGQVTNKCLQIGDSGPIQSIQNFSMQFSRSWFTINKVGDVLVAIGGKDNDDNRLGSVEIFNEDGAWWSIRGRGIEIPRSSHCSVPISEEEILVIGGWDGEDRLNHVEKYKWVPGGGDSEFWAPLSRGRRGLACGLFKDQVIVAGGDEVDGSYLTTVEALNIKTHDEWKPIASLPRSAAYGDMIVNCGRIELYDNRVQPDKSYYYIYDRWVTVDKRYTRWGITVTVPTNFR